MAATPEETTAAMDTGNTLSTETEESSQAPTMHVNHDGGRMAVAVTGMDATSADADAEGWQVARRRLRQRATGAASGESVLATPAASKSQARFAKQVAARITRAARMPHTLPREEIKIILRPRGGLNVGRTEATKLMAAIFAAAGTTLQESREDTICTNVAQNIIVISTPQESRAQTYAGIRQLRIESKEYEICAYSSAPDGTTKGVIRGISLSDTTQDLQANIVNEANPLALEAHRIGNTTTVIVAFAGTKVPNVVKYGAMLVRCSLYRQHYDVCHCCGKLGHRTDVCPSPDTRICFACGAPNPGPTHEQECKPRCKLCNGAHPTGVAGCKNRYKIPHVVTQRRWERRLAEAQQPPLGLSATDFPRLQPCENGAKRMTHKNADVDRAADGGTSAGGGTAHRSGDQNKPGLGGGATWADVAGSRPTRGANPQQPKGNPLQPTPEMIQLRNENARLKAQLAEQDRRLQEVSKKLDMLLANQYQDPARTPLSARGQAQKQARAQEQDLEQMQTQEPTHTHATGPQAVELPGEATQDANTAEEPEPKAKRRATVTSAIKRRHQQVEERMDKFEEKAQKGRESTNTRLAAVEAATADITIRMTNIERILTQIQQAMLRPSEGPQYHPTERRPSWPEQR